jgi:hypothetical protein
MKDKKIIEEYCRLPLLTRLLILASLIWRIYGTRRLAQLFIHILTTYWLSLVITKDMALSALLSLVLGLVFYCNIYVFQQSQARNQHARDV